MPDYQGLFLRGLGSQAFVQNNGSTVGVTSTLHQSGALGQVQGDGMRNVTGWTEGHHIRGGAGPYPENGAIFKSGSTVTPAQGSSGGVNQLQRLSLDVSRVVPTAGENRPANTAVRYLVRALH